ncbi:hypothetical protein HDU67_000218, partial [Dinochytrium kinnereticum]
MSDSEKEVEKDKERPDLFSGEDFLDWKQQMELWLTTKKMWSIVKFGITPYAVDPPTAIRPPTKEEQKLRNIESEKDVAARFKILRRVAKYLRPIIRDEPTAQAMWKRLTDSFERTGQTNRNAILKKAPVQMTPKEAGTVVTVAVEEVDKEVGEVVEEE